MKFDGNTKKALLDVQKKNQIFLEGNILKLIDSDGDKEFQEYIEQAIAKDKDNRRKRLEITKQIQNQNKELILENQENML
jgi:hypothetical protein